MNIGIDARALTDRKAGIGYYLENALHNILKRDKTNKYFLFSDRKIIFDIGAYNNVFLIEDTKNKVLKKTFWYVLKLPFIVNKMDIDIFWGSQQVLPFFLKSRIKKIVTIHDLVYIEMPETMNLYNKMICKVMVPYSIKKADEILSDSMSTKKGIMKYYGVESKDINLIYCAPMTSKFTAEDCETFFSKYLNVVKSKYLLYVGTIEPRKNIDGLLKAYEKIYEATGLELVLCGKIGWKCQGILEQIQNHKYKDNIVYLNYVSDIDKSVLMENCFAFIFPSHYEGFGIPVVEAMENGAVVVISDNSSLSELVEMKELKFTPGNLEELAEKTINLYKNTELYNDAKQYSSIRAKDFSWDVITEQYLNTFSKYENR